MPEKPISPSRSKITMTLRVNEAQKNAVKKRAAELDVSQSWYLMHLVEEDLKRQEAEVVS